MCLLGQTLSSVPVIAALSVEFAVALLSCDSESDIDMVTFHDNSTTGAFDRCVGEEHVVDEIMVITDDMGLGAGVAKLHASGRMCQDKMKGIDPGSLI